MGRDPLEMKTSGFKELGPSSGGRFKFEFAFEEKKTTHGGTVAPPRETATDYASMNLFIKFRLEHVWNRSHGVMVSTPDSESGNPSSNLGGTSVFLLLRIDSVIEPPHRSGTVRDQALPPPSRLPKTPRGTMDPL